MMGDLTSAATASNKYRIGASARKPGYGAGGSPEGSDFQVGVLGRKPTVLVDKSAIRDQDRELKRIRTS
jgi:hypothetical protein